MSSKTDPHSTRLPRTIDRVIELMDASLRTLTGTNHCRSERTQSFPQDGSLTHRESKISASLMRVNHTGEICAQGLYEGQAMVARDPATRRHLRAAAAEEVEHLTWCRMRLRELSSPESIFAPAFFLGSIGIGAITGSLGDKISLGFVEATEDEVRKHIDRHLAQLPETDVRTRAILKKIREDEIQHGTEAIQRGGIEFTGFVKDLMTLVSKVMTTTTQKI